MRGRVGVFLAILVVLTVLGGASWVLLESGQAATSRVEVTGLDRLDRAEVLRSARIRLGEPLVLLDTGEVERAITAELPAARAAAVSRRWPRTVRIDINERVAVAGVRTREGVRLLDRDGVAFALAPKLPAGSVPINDDTPRGRGAVRDDPPVTLPPVAAPPAAVPPAAVPPAAVPPGAVPPASAPPGAVAPGAVPPPAVPSAVPSAVDVEAARARAAEAQAAGERALANAAIVVAALPPEVREQVEQVTARGPHAIDLELLDDRVVRWGGPERSARKVVVLEALLSHAAEVYDVSAPDAPTIRG